MNLHHCPKLINLSSMTFVGTQVPPPWTRFIQQGEWNILKGLNDIELNIMKYLSNLFCAIERIQPISWRSLFEAVSYTHLTLPTNREV